MLKIGSCTVLYNPDSSVISNIETYSSLCDVCVVVDNSDSINEFSKYFEDNPSFVYISMHGNQGIAAAINAGVEYLHLKGMDFVLTMDQDSQFPTKDFEKIYSLIEKYKDEYSLIGLDVNKVSDDQEIKDVPYWITSGNFVNIRDFYKVGRMNESLFIDYVDFDLGYKFKPSYQHNREVNGNTTSANLSKRLYDCVIQFNKKRFVGYWIYGQQGKDYSDSYEN